MGTVCFYGTSVLRDPGFPLSQCSEYFLCGILYGRSTSRTQYNRDTEMTLGYIHDASIRSVKQRMVQGT
jgi:hypothetical protein